MLRLFKNYFQSLESIVPTSYFIFLFVLSIILYIIQNVNNRKEISKRIGLVGAVVYSLYLLGALALFRPGDVNSTPKLIPLYSYYELFEKGISTLFPQIIINILIFTPLGLFFRMTCPQMLFVKVCSWGMSISILLELLQLKYKKGLFEVDDILHNTLGFVIGILIYSAIAFVKKKQESLRQNSLNNEE